jgi:hypothetical protein
MKNSGRKMKSKKGNNSNERMDFLLNTYRSEYRSDRKWHAAVVAVWFQPTRIFCKTFDLVNGTVCTTAIPLQLHGQIWSGSFELFLQFNEWRRQRVRHVTVALPAAIDDHKMPGTSLFIKALRAWAKKNGVEVHLPQELFGLRNSDTPWLALALLLHDQKRLFNLLSTLDSSRLTPRLREDLDDFCVLGRTPEPLKSAMAQKPWTRKAKPIAEKGEC